VPRVDSQDGWVFVSPFVDSPLLVRKVEVLLNFTPGRPRCDNRVAEVLANELGFRLANPALALRTYHVHSGASPAVAAARAPVEDDEEVGNEEAGASTGIYGYSGATQVPGAIRNVPISMCSFG